MTAWTAPDYQEVSEVISRLADAKARLRRCELALKLFEADQAKRAQPRNPTQRTYGVTDADTEQWKQIQSDLTAAQAEVDRLSLTLRFLEFQKDIYIAELYYQRPRSG